MKDITVSIVVPIFNVEKYLEDCVKSLINQTYTNLEIILVDDGSTDESSEICDKYAKQDNRIRVIHKENGGPASARESGIDSATGEYLMIVDGDDWLDSTTVEDCLSAMLSDERCECVMFSYVKEYPGSSVVVHVIEGDKSYYGDEAEDKVYRRLFGLVGDELAHPERLAAMGSCCMKLYKTEIAKRGRYYHTSEVGSAEDALFCMYALHGVGGFIYIDKPYYHYRKTDNSLTATYRPRLRQQWNRLYDIMEGIITEKCLPEKYREAHSNYIALNVIGAGMNEFSDKSVGFWAKKKRVKTLLSDDRINTALKRLDTSKMPMKWKLFMCFARHKMAFMLSILYCVIKSLKKKG